MIDRVIELSLRNKFLVVMLWIGIAGWGLWAMLPRRMASPLLTFGNASLFNVA
jgi:Cu/Ag efflux pump CusA